MQATTKCRVEMWFKDQEGGFELTEDDYGGDIIKELKERWKSV